MVPECSDIPHDLTTVPLGLVRRACTESGEHPASPATLESFDGDLVQIRYLDGVVQAVTLCDPRRFAAVISRDDVCRLRGHPLVLVNDGAQPSWQVLRLAER